MEAESCKSSCCRRGGMDEDWMTSSKTNMYDHLVAVVEASYFRGADVVAIADVETQSPLVLGVFQQLSANLARDYREAALVIGTVSGVLELLNHSVVVSPCPFPSPSPPSLPPSLPSSLHPSLSPSLPP